ncbi:MAG: ABC transporter permease [Acidobacteriota bacterium]
MSRMEAILQQALQAVRAYRLRTFFCLVSVALGIASITIIVAATEGAYKKAYDLVGMFGPDSILVIGGSDETRAVGQRDKTLSLDDVKAVREAFPGAYAVVPMVALPETGVTYRNNKYQCTVIGSTADYSSAWTWPVVEGSDLSDDEVRGVRNVALIGRYTANKLFDAGENPVGKTILVKQIPVQIVGVLMERGTAPTGASLDDRLVMPITTVMKKLQNEAKYISVFRVRFTDQSRLESQTEEVRRLLRLRHRLNEREADNFKIISPKEIIKFLVAITGSLVVFLGVVGIISLVVAGFVLANLFLLSVKERTKEIGIRRSIGAKRGDIRAQFLGEAVIITTLGGILGFLLGLGGSELLTAVAQFPMYFSWKPFAIGLVLSWIVGIGFGLQPASRAANLNPIEAIRS